MKRAVCVALLLALGGNARAADFEFNALPETPARPRVVLAPREAPVAVLLVHFGAGAVSDGANPGLTRVTQHMMLRHNRRMKYDALLESLHAASATLTMQTGVHGADFLLVAPRAEFLTLASAVLSLTLSPQLVEAQLRKAVELALLGTRQAPDAEEVMQDFARSLTADPRFQNDRYGDSFSLEAITKKKLKAHLAGPMSAANATVVALGDFDPALFEELVGGFKGGRRLDFERPALTLPTTTRALARGPVHLLGYEAAPSSPRDRAAMRLLAAVLEDEVRAELRERGAGHSVAAQPLYRPWLDAIVLTVQGPPFKELSPLLGRRVAALREGKLSEAVFERNRRHVQSRMRALDRDPEELAKALASCDVDVSWLGRETLDAVESSTQGELVAAARAWLEQGARFEIEFVAPSTAQGASAASTEGSAP